MIRRIAPHFADGVVGTDFRHAVEFSRSGRAPSRAFRLVSGATRVTLRGWLRGVKPGGLPHHPRPRPSTRGGTACRRGSGGPRSDPVRPARRPRRGTQYVTGLAESNRSGGPQQGSVGRGAGRSWTARSGRKQCSSVVSGIFPPIPDRLVSLGRPAWLDLDSGCNGPRARRIPLPTAVRPGRDRPAVGGRSAAPGPDVPDGHQIGSPPHAARPGCRPAAGAAIHSAATGSKSAPAAPARSRWAVVSPRGGPAGACRR